MMIEIYCGRLYNLSESFFVGWNRQLSPILSLLPTFVSGKTSLGKVIHSTSFNRLVTIIFFLIELFFLSIGKLGCSHMADHAN